LKPDLEWDFKSQQALLFVLLDERKELTDASDAARKVDKQIAKVEDVVRSYQTVKWYEQDLEKKARARDGARSAFGSWAALR
jgi:hypothetical protein